MSIKVNDRVVLGVDEETQKEIVGTVKDIIHSDIGKNVVIVERDDKELAKILEENLTLAPEDIKTESDTITISKEDFKKAVDKVIDPNRYRDMFSEFSSSVLVCMSGVVVCDRLRRELFGE